KADTPTAHQRQLLLGDPDQVLARQQCLAAHLRRSRQQAKHGEPSNRLARTRLAHHPERLTPAQREVQSAQCRLAVEGKAEVSKLNERRGAARGHEAPSDQPRTLPPQFAARKSIAKSGADFHCTDFSLPVNVTFWLSTV